MTESGCCSSPESTQAQKNLADATLLAPCDGIISQRLVNAGESIAMHQPAMEIVQVDRVLLIVGVPESRVQELDNRRRLLASRRPPAVLTDSAVDPTTVAIPTVHVQLMGTDRFGQSLAGMWTESLSHQRNSGRQDRPVRGRSVAGQLRRRLKPGLDRAGVRS